MGDVASLAGPGGKPLPGLATVAIQQAHHVAKAIGEGRPGASTPFRYFDKGALAVVGRGKAVCEIRGLQLWGRPAFFTYLGVHLYYLGGQIGRRVEVLIKWIGARFGERQSALIEGELATVERSRRATPSPLDDRHRDPDRPRHGRPRAHPVRDDVDLSLPVRAADARAWRRWWR